MAKRRVCTSDGLLLQILRDLVRYNCPDMMCRRLGLMTVTDACVRNRSPVNRSCSWLHKHAICTACCHVDKHRIVVSDQAPQGLLRAHHPTGADDQQLRQSLNCYKFVKTTLTHGGTPALASHHAAGAAVGLRRCAVCRH